VLYRTAGNAARRRSRRNRLGVNFQPSDPGRNTMSTGIGLAAGMARAAQVVGVNAIPVAGIIGDWWSSGTALALYWIESVLVIGLMAARIVLHRRWTHKAGHWRKAKVTLQSDRPRGLQPKGSFLGSYLQVAITFTVAHGIFLGMLLFMLTMNRPDLGVLVDPGSLEIGTAAIVVFLAVGFLVDVPSLAQRPFRWLERLVERSLGRVVVLHLVIIFGMVGLALTDSPMGLLGVFAGFKALVEIGGIFPEKEAGPEPPVWLRWMNRLPAKNGETFAEFWRRTEQEETRRRKANERVVDTAKMTSSA